MDCSACSCDWVAGHARHCVAVAVLAPSASDLSALFPRHSRTPQHHARPIFAIRHRRLSRWDINAHSPGVDIFALVHKNGILRRCLVGGNRQRSDFRRNLERITEHPSQSIYNPTAFPSGNTSTLSGSCHLEIAQPCRGHIEVSLISAWSITSAW